MKILIAPDKFKGSLSADEVCEAIQKGIHRFDSSIETVLHPLADGGEGTLEILNQVLELETVHLTVKDPLSRPVQVFYKKNKDTAFIEMALASGLPLLSKEERNPLKTSTFGTGQLIADAIKKGAKEIYLFIGGSATNDAGMGMATALGFHFLDKNGKELPPVGASLFSLKKIEIGNFPKGVKTHVVCDVKNPLFGPNGAAHVYAPQKGADEKAIHDLDAGLRNFSRIVRRDLSVDIADMPGAGAAGGLGAGAVAFLGADILPGIETIMDITHFSAKLEGVDFIISGEGKLDDQTSAGKVVAGVAKAGRAAGIPVGVVCGTIEAGEEALEKMGIGIWQEVLSEGVSLEKAMSEAGALVEQRAFQLVKKFAGHSP